MSNHGLLDDDEEDWNEEIGFSNRNKSLYDRCLFSLGRGCAFWCVDFRVPILATLTLASLILLVTSIPFAIHKVSWALLAFWISLLVFVISACVSCVCFKPIQNLARRQFGNKESVDNDWE
ncbi:hypothetical protein PROFUN_07296 [Planoprotostelium fungivorum]|uniref:Uncharacterized protein n=1 Tax=Planoprotostelium fungivorum TaxID=1890364 RepID=A0A2P6NM75_9EUKA|nr:hypothetical protein PROFUN_07296 [Planoprotostelium fungivorum]